MTSTTNDQPEYLSSATLMVLGTSLRPHEVSALLRMRASEAWARGEPKLIRGKGMGDTFHDWGGWKKTLPPAQRARSLPQQLRYWARSLTDKAGALSQLAALGYRCELNCFVGTSSTATLVLPPDLQRTIGDLGLTLSLNVFASP
jgi:hypothetical protein